jgi:hypothetical protein
LLDSETNTIEAEHQVDMQRHDTRFEQETISQLVLILVQILKKLIITRIPRPVDPFLEPKPKLINIAAINRVTFSINTRNPENKIFITSIREIKTILQDRELEQ